ncbi:MAG TPA: acetate--CoA ligase family protein [Actinomycetales bacterium]|nr:acetate--CoA ligase family protein [Actinomycetales bacterium]
MDGSTADLSVLWDASAIAVVGATDRAGALGRMPVEHLQRYGYAGRIVPVNPKGGTVCGIPAVTDLTEATAAGRVDLALVMVPAAATADVVREAGRAGIGVCVVMSSGFAETGEEGQARQDELLRVAAESGVRLVGPNCIGSVGFGNGQVATFSPLFGAEHVPITSGRLGFATQSGALGYGAVSLALERGLGLAAAVNTGNEADVGALEVLEALADDASTDALIGYVEALGDGERLRRIAASGKPLALLKAGSSEAGSRAAASHTGALATSDRVVDDVLRQLGVARAHDVDELLDLADALLTPRRPAGPRVAVVTTSGGSGILAADAIEQHGLRLATLSEATREALDEIVPAFGATANPVDVTATVMSDPTLFDRSLDLIAGDDGVDAVVACFCVLTGTQVMGIVESLQRVAERTGKPVVVTRTGADFLAPDATAALRAARLPAYPTPGRAVRALAASWLTTRPRTKPLQQKQFARPTRTDEPGLKAWLRDSGVAVPPGRLVGGAAAAAEAVREVGGLAVVKAVVPGLLHKTEAGGVALGVTPESAGDAFDRMAALGAATPGSGVLVEQMAQRDHAFEVLVGVAPSPLGPVLSLAAGGVLTEVLRDASFRLLPLAEGDAASMVDGLRSAPLLRGHRGAPMLDEEGLVQLLETVSALALTLPDGASLDLNPVLVTTDGCVVLDAALATDDHDTMTMKED